MSSKGFQVSLSFAAMLLMGACRFIDDNQVPGTTWEIFSDKSSSSCGNLKAAWEKIDNEEDLSDIDSMKTELICHLDAYHKKIASIQTPRSEGLYPEEVAAIAKEFFLKERPLRAEEVSVFLLVKAILIHKSENTFHKDDIQLLKTFVKDFGTPMLAALRGNNSEAIFDLLFEAKNFPSTLSLREEHIVGMSFLAERFVEDLDLSQIRPRLRELIPALNPFFGYSTQMRRLPLGQILSRISEIRSDFERIDNLGWGELAENRNAASFKAFEALVKGEIRALSEKILSVTGFSRGALLTQADWLRLLNLAEKMAWSFKGESKEIRFEIGSAELARVLQSSLSYFSGRPDSSRVDGKDLRAVFEQIFLSEILADYTRGIRIATHERTSVLEAYGLSAARIRSFHEMGFILRLQYRDASRADTRLDDSDFGYFFAKEIEMRLMQALHRSFDADKDGLLDLSKNLNDNEFKQLLKLADKVLLGISKIFDSESKSALLKSEEDVKAKTSTISSDVDAILSSPKSSLVLSVFADNMTPFSNSDGAINAAELYLLVEELQSVNEMQRFYAELRASERKHFLPYLALFSAYSPSSFDSRQKIFMRQFVDALGYPRSSADSSCALQSFHEAQVLTELERSLQVKCPELSRVPSDRLEEVFVRFKHWMFEASQVIEPEEVLSNDEFVLAALLNRWVDHVSGSLRVPGCHVDNIEDVDACLPAMSRLDFEELLLKNMGPSALRIFPPRLRAPLLAAHVPPAKLLSKLLYAAPQILREVKSNTLSPEGLSRWITETSASDNQKLSYTDLTLHAWALSQLMIHLGDKAN